MANIDLPFYCHSKHKNINKTYVFIIIQIYILESVKLGVAITYIITYIQKYINLN